MDLFSNPWVIGIGTAVVAGLILNFLKRRSPKSQSNTTHNGDIVGRDKYVYPQIESTKKTAEVICAWSIPERFQENDEILIYEFTPTLQNKGEEIINDFWINFSSSGFNLKIEKTPHTELFEGWNINNEALNLISKYNYRFAPQNLVCPFKIKIVLKKEMVPNDAWLYYSYGATNLRKVERKVSVTRDQLQKFVKSSNRSTYDFLQLLRLSK